VLASVPRSCVCNADLPEDLVILAVGAKPRCGPLVDPAYFENLRAALASAVTGIGPVEPSMAALAGLVQAGDIDHLVYPGRENVPLRARLAELSGQDPAMTVPGARPETSNLDDPFRFAAQAAVHSAVHHSVHAAVSAATATSHHSGGSSSVALDATEVRVAGMADVPGAGGHEEDSLAITERYRIR
jgi:hypothetical protein